MPDPDPSTVRDLLRRGYTRARIAAKLGITIAAVESMQANNEPEQRAVGTNQMRELAVNAELSPFDMARLRIVEHFGRIANDIAHGKDIDPSDWRACHEIIDQLERETNEPKPAVKPLGKRGPKTAGQHWVDQWPEES